jgi:hypothetical protein
MRTRLRGQHMNGPALAGGFSIGYQEMTGGYTRACTDLTAICADCLMPYAGK